MGDKLMPVGAKWAVRPAQTGDEWQLASLHCEAFPGFFLTELGARFLRRLYRAFLVAKDSVCLAAVTVDAPEPAVVGFVVGTTQPPAFFRRILRRQWFGFVWDAVPAIARRPSVVARRMLGALTYRGEKPANVPGAALLSSIAVADGYRGKGVADALVSAFCEEVRRRGSSAVYLTTDRVDNRAANAFYQRIGFSLYDVLVRSGDRSMNRYIRAL